MEKGSLLEEDRILLFCQKAQGFIFSPPPLNSKVSNVSLHSIKDPSQVNYPGFSNIHYASFKIQPSTCSIALEKSRGDNKESKALVYGRKVWLLHVASKWYLSFQATENNDRPEVASLVEETKDASTFRILPSDPTKSTGQTISIEDTVRLEIDTIGKIFQILCAPNALNIRGYDLKKASDGSDFTLYSQSTGDKLFPPLALKGGEVVMFLNEKRDAYLTVVKRTVDTSAGIEEDVTADTHHSTFTKEVFAKVNDGTTQRSVFTGGDSFWQIEHSKVQYNGNWIGLNKPCTLNVHIRHLPSKLYLFLVKGKENGGQKKSKLVLQKMDEEEDKNKNAVFQFITEESKPDQGVLKRRYVSIKHVESGKYICLDGKSGKLIDGHRCFKIVGSDPSEADVSVQRDQKFWIEEVDSEILKKFDTLSGAFIILRDYMQQLKEKGSMIPLRIVDALAEWSGKESGGLQEKWPDMLRVMEGVELVLEFLERETNPVTKSVSSLQKHLFVVLKNYIEYASEESQLHLISQDKLLNILLLNMGLEIGAEDVFSALVKCQSFGTEQKQKVLCHKRFGVEYILNTILEKRKDFTILQCLSALCLSGGRPKRSVQRDLLEKIIIPAFDMDIFFKIHIADDNSITLQYPKMFKGCSDNKKLDGFLEDFLIMQIEFYSAVCKGVNVNSIETMVDKTKGILTYAQAVKCTECKDFSPRVQSVFFSYLVSTLVEKNAEESGTDLENIWYIYAWNLFVDEEQTFDPVVLSVIGDTYETISDKEEMVKMQEKIQVSLKEEKLKGDIEDGREELITQRLSVLETLVAYGFYFRADSEVHVPPPATVIKALTGILDEWSTASQEKKQVLSRPCTKAIEVLKLFLHQTYHLGTARMIFDYRYFQDPSTLSVENQENYVIPKDGLKELTARNCEIETHPGIFSQLSPFHQNKVQEGIDRLKWVLYQDPAHSEDLVFLGQKTSYEYEQLNIYDEDSKSLQNRLVEFLTCGDELLCLSAAKLLFELFKGELIVFDRSEKALAVMESHKSSWQTFTTMARFSTFTDKDEEEFVRALLRLLLQGKGNDERAKSSLDTFLTGVVTTAGIVPTVDGLYPFDETYTCKVGQKIVLTTGVVCVLLDYVVKFSASLDSDQDELIIMSCKALIRVARGNKDVKEVVFARFDGLLQAKHGVSAIAHLLTEVLTDNIDACRKLPFSTVRQMFRMAAVKDSENSEYLEYIPTLEAWAKVSKSSPQLLIPHQRFLTSLFKQFFIDYYKSDWDPKDSPCTELEKTNNDKFLLLMRMMSVCAEGIHKYSEDVLRDILDFKTLMDIMVDQTVPLEHRLPFLMIMNEAFMDTEQESLVSVFEFAKNRCVWAYVNSMIELIENIDTKLKSIDPTTPSLMCQKIKIRVISSQHMTHMYWKKHKVWDCNLKGYLKDDLKDAFPEEKVSLGDQTYTLGIVYQYLIEGLVPVLSVFAEEYTRLWQLYKHELTQQPLCKDDSRTLKAFGLKLKCLVTDNSRVFVTTRAQKRYWESRLKPILLIKTDEDEVSEPTLTGTGQEQVDELNILVTKDPVEPDESEKEKEKEEEDVNTNFQIYLRNFKKLVCHDDLENDPQCLYPRGPGFQKLLDLIFLQEMFDDEEIKKRITALVGLLEIIQKQLQQTFDSKEKSALDELSINILQILSAFLKHFEDKEDKSNLCKWQMSYKELEVHKKCSFYLDHANEEVVLQVLALLRLITLDPNTEAECQTAVFELISMRDSVFCHRVHGLLQDVTNTFKEPKAESKEDTRVVDQAQNQATESSPHPSNGTDNIGQEDFPMTEMSRSPEPQEEDEEQDQTDVDVTGTLESKSLDNNIRTASIVLECISALCDGQHREMQRYLHDQEQSLRKLDIVKKIAILLQVLTKEFEKNVEVCKCSVKSIFSYLHLIQKAIQALIETSTGNFENQQAVLHCQITDTIKLLLMELANDKRIATDSMSKESSEKIKKKRQKLSEKAIELLQVLLEETDDRSQSLIANFTEDVDLDTMVKAMFTWKNIGAYHILRLVANAQDIVVDRLVCNKMRTWDKSKKKLWDDFKARSRAIEVLYQPKGGDKKILTKVYFDFDPSDEAHEEHKETVTNAITEESQEESLTEFNKWARSIRQNAKYKHKLNEPHLIWLFRIVYETSAPRHLLLVLLTVVLNLLILAVLFIPDNLQYNVTNTTSFILYPFVPVWYYPYLLSFLGAVHIILSVWMVFEYIVVEKPNFTEVVFFFTFIQKLRKSFTRWVSQQECFRSRCPNDWGLKQKKRKKGDDNVEDYYYDEDEDGYHGYFKVDIFGFQSIYRFFFLICSIAAIPLRGYTYPFCLFYVFLKVDVVQYILTALHRSVKQLVFVALIGAAVLLVFAMGSFIFLHGYFFVSDDQGTTLYCGGLWQCFVTVSREGLLNSLGPAIPFYPNSDTATTSFTNYALRALFYDIPFFIIVTTIGLNIVTAVLIDRFSHLREERDKVKSKKMKACFICGLESEKFERYGKGFRNHVKEDHNKWNYVYYLIHLDRTPANKRTALGKQIAENNPMEKKYGKTDHFPIKRAKVLPEKFQEIDS